jgi:hypothetical protein
VNSYESLVRALPCLLCRHLGYGDTPSELHHLEFVRDALSAYACVPLCVEHHRGATGVHGMSRKVFAATYKLSDVDLLAMVNKQLHEHG